MTYWRTARANSGGDGHSHGPHSADYTRADLELLFPADPPLPRGYLAQAMLDVLTVLIWAVLGCLGILIVGGPLLALGWILFFS